MSVKTFLTINGVLAVLYGLAFVLMPASAAPFTGSRRSRTST